MLCELSNGFRSLLAACCQLYVRLCRCEGCCMRYDEARDGRWSGHRLTTLASLLIG